MIYVAGLFLCILVNAEKNEGDLCTDDNTFSEGYCRPAHECEKANSDFLLNGIRPTFCDFNQFSTPLICCRDDSTILQAGNRRTLTSRLLSLDPVENNSISERKCEEYSRGVISKVNYIPLVPNPEARSISTAKCDYSGVQLIIGGETASQGEFPHMAAIGWANLDGGYSFFCGGSLISPKFVLTAAHCLTFRDTTITNPKPVVVRLGDQNIDATVEDGADPVDVPIRRAVPHPEYEYPSTYNDIALFELATDVEYRATVRPACLWTKKDFGAHNRAIASGWGVTDANLGTKSLSKELQKVSLPLFDNDYCDRLLYNVRNKRNWQGFRETQMCAGALEGGKDTCQGDSGAPLQVASKSNQCIFHIIGVTSFGRRCAESGRPAVYTRISEYLPWIESVVWPEEI